MSEETRDELSRLLWCYTKPANEEKADALKTFLKERKIPPMMMLCTFKHCEETHLRAVNALSHLMVRNIQQRKVA